jgi:hypothetical protein
MALTTTNVTGAIATGAQTIIVSGYTNPTTGAVSAKVMGQFVTGERVLIVDATNSPTLSVVRGYAGTVATGHSSLEGFSYGLMSDAAWQNYYAFQQRGATANQQVVQAENIQVVTITGATGTTAAIITVPAPAFLNCTGTSGAGLNLPIPNVGDCYEVKNNTTGVCNVYCVGGTINATTGTTANAITATGTLTSIYRCSVSGTWAVSPLSQ